jgi:hypothetical protein
MPRPKKTVPSYLHHKTTGQARVRIKVGSRYRDIYLGPYNSPESRQKYQRILAEYSQANDDGGIPTIPVSAEDDWTVATLAVKYDDFVRTHYVKNGEPTDERYQAAISPLVELYGTTLAREFGPKRFQALREPTAYLFSPRQVAEANARELEQRRKRPNSKKVRLSQSRPPHEHYDDRGYRQAVVRACRRAGVSEWTPGRLRHNAGTKVRALFGAEAAQLVLGHRNLSTTEIYAEKNRARYEEIAKQIG